MLKECHDIVSELIAQIPSDGEGVLILVDAAVGAMIHWTIGWDTVIKSKGQWFVLDHHHSGRLSARVAALTELYPQSHTLYCIGDWPVQIREEVASLSTTLSICWIATGSCNSGDKIPRLSVCVPLTRRFFLLPLSPQPSMYFLDSDHPGKRVGGPVSKLAQSTLSTIACYLSSFVGRLGQLDLYSVGANSARVAQAMDRLRESNEAAGSGRKSVGLILVDRVTDVSRCMSHTEHALDRAFSVLSPARPDPSSLLFRPPSDGTGRTPDPFANALHRVTGIGPVDGNAHATEELRCPLSDVHVTMARYYPLPHCEPSFMTDDDTNNDDQTNIRPRPRETCGSNDEDFFALHDTKASSSSHGSVVQEGASSTDFEDPVSLPGIGSLLPNLQISDHHTPSLIPEGCLAQGGGSSREDDDGVDTPTRSELLDTLLSQPTLRGSMTAVRNLLYDLADQYGIALAKVPRKGMASSTHLQRTLNAFAHAHEGALNAKRDLKDPDGGSQKDNGNPLFNFYDHLALFSITSMLIAASDAARAEVSTDKARAWDELSGLEKVLVLDAIEERQSTAAEQADDQDLADVASRAMPGRLLDCLKGVSTVSGPLPIKDFIPLCMFGYSLAGSSQSSHDHHRAERALRDHFTDRLKSEVMEECKSSLSQSESELRPSVESGIQDFVERMFSTLHALAHARRKAGLHQPSPGKALGDLLAGDVYEPFLGLLARMVFNIADPSQRQPLPGGIMRHSSVHRSADPGIGVSNFLSRGITTGLGSLFGARSQSTTAASSETRVRHRGPADSQIVIIFVLGGITFDEVRIILAAEAEAVASNGWSGETLVGSTGVFVQQKSQIVDALLDV